MKKITRERGLDKKSPSPTAKEVGLIIPDEETCKQCHVSEIEWNGKTFKNPSFEEPFDFDEEFEEIEHPVPESRRKDVIAGKKGSGDEDEK